MKEIIIILIFLLIANHIHNREHFNANNKFGYKSIPDIPIGILMVLYNFIMKIISKPLSILLPTPLYLKGPKAPKCHDGLEKETGLCYKKCKDKYKGVGPVCWEKCPPDAKSLAVACWIKKSCKDVKEGKNTVKKCTGPKLQPKKTYGRGVGKIPNICHDPDTFFFGLGCKEYGLFGKIKNRFNVIW